MTREQANEMKSISMWFQILDENDNVLIGRTIKFPYPIDAIRIDREVAEIFLRIAKEKGIN